MWGKNELFGKWIETRSNASWGFAYTWASIIRHESKTTGTGARQGLQTTLRNQWWFFLFQQIKRFVHICEPTGDKCKSLFFNKVELLFTHVMNTLEHLWIPGMNVSTDEMTVMKHGRSREPVRMKNKPIRFGFKIWAHYDSGYTFSLFRIPKNTHRGKMKNTMES